MNYKHNENARLGSCDTFWHRLTWLLLFFMSTVISVNAQLTVNGNPGDWANFQTNPSFPTNAYAHDANNSNDNQFTQGSKDGNNINTWAWSNGSTNNKGDVTNAGAILTTLNGHNVLFFFGDRAVNNGDAAIGFWFFKNTVGLIGTTSGTFSGVHADGDILIVSHFTQGGGQADVFIYRWQNGGLTAPVTSSTAAVNAQSFPVPAGLAYASANYPTGDFFEGMIDLTALNIPPCFANFLIETRNSQSITASLQDFAFGSFTQTIAPPVPTPAERCGDGPVSLSASGCSGGTLKWFDAASGGNLVFTGNPFNIANLTATKTYYVNCTTADGCVSNRAAVTATWNPIPDVNAVNNRTHCKGDAGAAITFTGSVPNTTFTWSSSANVGFGLSGTGSISAYTAANATNAPVTATITVTPSTAKCTGQAITFTVTVNPTPTVNAVGNRTHCNGESATGITFSGPVSGTSFAWTSSANVGFGLSGTGSIAAYTATTGASGTTATVTVTPTANNCTGPAITFTVTVNPNAAPPDVTYIPPTCTENTFKVQVNNPQVGTTYKLTQLDNNVVTIGPYQSGTLIFTGLHIGQGFSVEATTSAGCKSNPFDCGVFNHSNVSARIAQNTKVETLAEPTVVAAPNPFNDRIRFSVKSPVSGQGSLELFNILGQKVKTLFQGRVEKGMIQTFEYNVPGSQRSNLIYLFRVGQQKVTGKLIGLK